MSFQTLTFIVPGPEAAALSDALIDAGALSVDVADADSGSEDEQAAFGQPGAEAPIWPRARLSVLFAAAAHADAILASACEASGLKPPIDPERAHVDDQDWVRLTRGQFQPIRISARLWIVPTWATAPEPDAINLSLDPGTAFGTGSHPSTRLCLRWLVEHLAGGEHVLDYGCGSGILAIAALRLGAAVARGIDIDPQAILAARANAMQNRVAAEFHEPGGDSGLRYDVVVANILANPLIALAPLLAQATLAHGRIVLSGILEWQAAEVMNAYSPWYDMVAPQTEEGWVLLAGQRCGGSAA